PHTVNVNPLTPPTGATANPAIICPGSSTTLSAQGAGRRSHSPQWFTDEALTQHLSYGQPVVSPTITTTYYVIYNYFCGVSTAVPVTVTVNTLNAYIFDQVDVSCHGGSDGELEIGV